MTSTALNSEERAVRDCLRDEYNVPEVAFIGGSRHPRAEFTYHRKRCVLTLHATLPIPVHGHDPPERAYLIRQLPDAVQIRPIKLSEK